MVNFDDFSKDELVLLSIVIKDQAKDKVEHINELENLWLSSGSEVPPQLDLHRKQADALGKLASLISNQIRQSIRKEIVQSN